MILNQTALQSNLQKMQEERDAAISDREGALGEVDQLTENAQNQKRIIWILLCSGCALLVVTVILCIVFHYNAQSVASQKMERALRDQRIRTLKANEPLPVIPRVHAKRLGVKEHPALRDQFGMMEVFDVTAGEGKDLVRIARPLETAGAERKLSEELMDIQPIIVGLEGSRSTQITSSGTGEGTLQVTEHCETSGI